ncbi:hypothetical protein R3X28_19205 [Maribacter sp. TH_r10]|uniref:hypothetical protein n=1 Tax=Maribacter sp. TH_r10 TaxID=3082086 RepID=UPI002954E17B|nr:hypothetical protein [Maribacter sp. TH_r10]MDV7141019.1 hypothetical protein [Maribacter sp. TH_r10]
MSLKNFEQIKKIILNFEDGKMDHKSALEKLGPLSEKEITEYDLINYWRSEGLDEFARTLAMPELGDWSKIDDKRALKLIVEMIEKVNDTALMLRNATALERRYKKSSGSVMELVFNQGIESEHEILSMLKKDTTIRL